MSIVLGLCIGVGLSAACGFRLFLPLLCMSVGSYTGHLRLTESLAWIGTTPALIAFGAATVVELVGYMVPWVDNALNALAIPMATVAGTLLTAGCVAELSPFLKWTLAAVAGGGSAGGIRVGLTGVRAATSATTGGIANPVLSLIEGFFSFVFSILAVIVPLIAAGLVIVAMVWIGWRVSPLLTRSLGRSPSALSS